MPISVPASPSAATPVIEELLRNESVWVAGRAGAGVAGIAGSGVAGTKTGSSIPTGFEVLDAALPSGGWPEGVLVELLCARQGCGELRLLVPALVDVTVRGRCVAWILAYGDAPHSPGAASVLVPYVPALVAHGVDPSQLLLVQPPAREPGKARRLPRGPQRNLRPESSQQPHQGYGQRQEDLFWAAEQALRSGACGLVLLWEAGGRPVHQRPLRRLQIAARAGGSTAVLFRTPERARHPSPAALRVLVEPYAPPPSRAGAQHEPYEPHGPHGPHGPEGISAFTPAPPLADPVLSMHLLKCRGRSPGETIHIGLHELHGPPPVAGCRWPARAGCRWPADE